MDNCFAACGCDDNEGITKSDLDRFTDKIENVLNDERGRKLFRNFMITSKFEDGCRSLEVWELNEKLLLFKDNAECGSRTYRKYLKNVDKLIDEADKIEELDFEIMDKLTIARDSEDKETIKETLQLLKVEVTKTIRREYSAFREHYINTTK